MDEGFFHLIVKGGPERGRRLTVPQEGARVGRSSSNDIILNDAALSRFHCRFFFKPDGNLWISDLGSTNETLVNNKPAQETRLTSGDRIEIGGTLIEVVCDNLAGRLPPSAPLSRMFPGSKGDSVDLGLRREKEERQPGALRFLWPVIAVIVAVVAIAILFKVVSSDVEPPAEAVAGEVGDQRFEFEYEKVEASAANIFRYYAQLRDGTLAVQIDNMENSRHVLRDKAVDEDLVAGLRRDLERSGFMDLRDDYAGLSPDAWHEYRLQVTVGRTAHGVKVLNRVEPDSFKAARERIEEFVQNELGLAALALPPDQLLQLARNSHLLSQRLYAQREVGYDNLAKAIDAYTETLWYLETIDPKPDYYAEALSGLEVAKEALETAYQDRLFQAERAIKLRNWNLAADNLRVICEMIPDRSDDRHQKAKKKLLDVERRMNH